MSASVPVLCEDVPVVSEVPSEPESPLHSNIKTAHINKIHKNILRMISPLLRFTIKIQNCSQTEHLSGNEYYLYS
jgi:hypothetical protein